MYYFFCKTQKRICNIVQKSLDHFYDKLMVISDVLGLDSSSPYSLSSYKKTPFMFYERSLMVLKQQESE